MMCCEEPWHTVQILPGDHVRKDCAIEIMQIPTGKHELHGTDRMNQGSSCPKIRKIVKRGSI